MYAENSMVSFQNLPCMTRTVELDIFFYWECNAEQFKKNRTNRNKKVSWLIALYSLMTRVCLHSRWGTDREQ